MQEGNIFEEFGLTLEEAAKVVIDLADAMRSTRNRADLIDSVSQEDESQRLFASFLIGLWNGMNLARLYPAAAEEEAAFLGKIQASFNFHDKEELIQIYAEEISKKY